MRDLLSIRHERSLARPFVPKIGVRKLKVGRILKRGDGFDSILLMCVHVPL